MIEVEQLGSVHVVHWHDDENRLDETAVAALHDALDRVEATEGPCALVTTGEGKFYCNGVDPDAPGAAGGGAGLVAAINGLLGRIMGFPAITVAAINGHAFGAGALLATAHDFRVMRHDRGYWCLPEIDLAVPLDPGFAAVAVAKLPRETAHEAIMTGQRYDAAEAQMSGIVNLTSSEDDLLADAVDLATDFAGKRRSVVAEHKRLLYADVLAVLGG
jgi:enoyl-CoA hydratase/carnithine racemase